MDLISLEDVPVFVVGKEEEELNPEFVAQEEQRVKEKDEERRRTMALNMYRGLRAAVQDKFCRMFDMPEEAWSVIPAPDDASTVRLHQWQHVFRMSSVCKIPADDLSEMILDHQQASRSQWDTECFSSVRIIEEFDVGMDSSQTLSVVEMTLNRQLPLILKQRSIVGMLWHQYDAVKRTHLILFHTTTHRNAASTVGVSGWYGMQIKQVKVHEAQASGDEDGVRIVPAPAVASSVVMFVDFDLSLRLGRDLVEYAFAELLRKRPGMWESAYRNGIYRV